MAVLISTPLDADDVGQGNISIEAEQQYWNEWIRLRNDKTCPLQPFVFGYTKAGLLAASELIGQMGDHDNAALFVRVSIDNGVVTLAYLAWDESDETLYSIHGDALKGAFQTEKGSASKNPTVSAILALARNDGFYDSGNTQTLDGESVYLTIKVKQRVTRFASYNPRIDRLGKEVTLEQFSKYMALQAQRTRKQKKRPPSD